MIYKLRAVTYIINFCPKFQLYTLAHFTLRIFEQIFIGNYLLLYIYENNNKNIATCVFSTYTTYI